MNYSLTYIELSLFTGIKIIQVNIITYFLYYYWWLNLAGENFLLILVLSAGFDDQIRLW
jgi:hypothetical protein